MKGIIVVHGTSQDSTSEAETTVQLAKAARAAGHLVVEIGGPGSTERAILRGLKRNPALADYTPIDEIGFPTDYAWDVLAGTATGAGIDDIVEDVLAAVAEMRRKKVTSIDFLGFSRGAVAISLALERMEAETAWGLRSPIPVRVCLLDPVPGPYLVPQRAVIPSFVKECLLLTSKHEGRPGFRNLELAVSPTVKFTGDLVMGVHGDIGGSTRSPMTRLVRDQAAAFLGLPTHRLTREERIFLQVMISLAPRILTHPGPAQWWSRRGIGWSETGGELERGVVELPSATAGEELVVQFPRVDSDWMEKFLRRQERLLQEEQARRNFARMQADFERNRRMVERMMERWEAPDVVVPVRPHRGEGNRIRFPPAVHRPRGTIASQTMGGWRRAFGGLKFFL